MAIRNQLVLSATMSYLAMTVGIGLTWPSFVVELLQSESTPLSRRMGSLDISLAGALSSAGGLLATPLYGYLLDRIGRKRCAVLCALPFIVSWSVIALSRSAEVVLCALFVSGLGCGGLLISTVYVGEVAESSVRGALTSAPVAGYALGKLVAYALGGYLAYHTVVYVQLTLAALYFPVVCLARESPVYLLQRGDDTVSWSVIALSRSAEVVLCALFVSGLGCGGLLISTVYVGEVAESSVRGALTSAPVAGYALGILVAYALGGYLAYHTVVYVQVTLAALYFPVVCLARESPVYLLQRGDETGATQSVAHYRGLPPDSKRVLEELYQIRRSLNPEANSAAELTQEQERLHVEVQPSVATQRLSSWQFFCSSRSSQRALLVCLALMLSSIFMGLAAVMVYADSLFRRASPGFSSTISSMMLALFLMAASLLAASISDRVGRKVLMMWSSVGCGVCTLLLASQLQCSWGPDWLAVPIILGFTFLYNIGAGTVPYILLGEVFLPEVRSACCMLLVESVWLFNFVLLFAFNPLVEAIILHNVFYLFSGVCWATVLFCWLYLPETKGLSADEIQRVFVPPASSRARRSRRAGAIS